MTACLKKYKDLVLMSWLEMTDEKPISLFHTLTVIVMMAVLILLCWWWFSLVVCPDEMF